MLNRHEIVVHYAVRATSIYAYSSRAREHTRTHTYERKHCGRGWTAVLNASIRAMRTYSGAYAQDKLYLAGRRCE